MKIFFDKFSDLKSSSFIGVKNYQNKYGEIANLSVNVNIDVKKAKEKDLSTLRAVNDADLKDISKSNDLPIETLKIALNELISSAEKNLSENKEDRTAQSNGQADAYIHLTPSVKMHKDTTNIFISGFVNNKKIIKEGEYPQKNKRAKTKCKDAIKKHCDLRMNCYRQYKLGEMDQINITGSTLQIK